MSDYSFKLDFSVRDYECDMQGIVNNAIYQNYLEHTRHQYLKTIGVDFAECTRNKINLVVIRAELDYKASLQSGDDFWIGLRMVKESRIKFAFLQDIYRSSDNKLMLKAKIIGTSLNDRGRPEFPEKLKEQLSLAAS